ncbi:DUF2306 domain-containing protein [Kumtagia ephedrae]|jgi:uncharacterized membrane protein|uniref:DUF2306 domain-containing protein n=1 Tax=Kumtagia ephedrae TaxID=2116701 RepID=A0A2P7STL9_9HYPH|nr:DUF2306 domain-containing protein [Mesorhizobium ephedrae]PSJ65820.1 hypothetical protein C7I84_01485 [Mesorhizobium ephedrae]
MSLEPLLAESAPIPGHALAALAALVLGAAQFALPKGTVRHRMVGFIWAGLMLFVAASGFWIHEIRLIGPWSPIHLLSVLVLMTVPLAVWHAHRHRVDRHRKAMISLYLLALVGAGLFTLLPGRVMHQVVFGG